MVRRRMIAEPPSPFLRPDRVVVLWRASRATAMATLVVLGGVARADVVLPVVDTTDLCEREVGTRAPDPRVQDCVSAERRALDYLSTAYAAVPARVRSRCERLSRRDTRGFLSYAFIQGCIDMK